MKLQLKTKQILVWQWWRTPLISALGRQRQADPWEFKASLVGLQSEFQDSQDYTEKPCLEKPKNKTRNKSYLKLLCIICIQLVQAKPACHTGYIHLSLEYSRARLGLF